MGSPSAAHVYFTGTTRASPGKITCIQRVDHRHPTGSPRAYYGQPTGMPWTCRGYHTGSPWASYVQPTWFPWAFHGYSRGIPRSTNVGIPRASHLHPTGMLWASISLPRGNGWASHEQPTDGAHFTSQLLFRGIEITPGGATKGVLLCAAATAHKTKGAAAALYQTQASSTAFNYIFKYRRHDCTPERVRKPLSLCHTITSATDTIWHLLRRVVVGKK